MKLNLRRINFNFILACFELLSTLTASSYGKNLKQFSVDRSLPTNRDSKACLCHKSWDKNVIYASSRLCFPFRLATRSLKTQMEFKSEIKVTHDFAGTEKNVAVSVLLRFIDILCNKAREGSKKASNGIRITMLLCFLVFSHRKRTEKTWRTNKSVGRGEFHI